MTDQTGAQVIQHIIEARGAAVRAGDIEGMMANVADDIVTFDVVDPLRQQGKDIARARATEWLASYVGPIGYLYGCCVRDSQRRPSWRRGLSGGVGTTVGSQ